MDVRTSASDRLIYEALQSGVDTVLNLGAGMDTRPYRMKLPANLQWVEMDFPNIVEYKPVCKLERVLLHFFILDAASLASELQPLRRSVCGFEISTMRVSAGYRGGSPRR